MLDHPFVQTITLIATVLSGLVAVIQLFLWLAPKVSFPRASFPKASFKKPKLDGWLDRTVHFGILILPCAVLAFIFTSFLFYLLHLFGMSDGQAAPVLLFSFFLVLLPLCYRPTLRTLPPSDPKKMRGLRKAFGICLALGFLVSLLSSIIPGLDDMSLASFLGMSVIVGLTPGTLLTMLFVFRHP